MFFCYLFSRFCPYKSAPKPCSLLFIDPFYFSWFVLWFWFVSIVILVELYLLFCFCVEPHPGGCTRSGRVALLFCFIRLLPCAWGGGVSVGCFCPRRVFLTSSVCALILSALLPCCPGVYSPLPFICLLHLCGMGVCYFRVSCICVFSMVDCSHVILATRGGWIYRQAN